MKTTTRFVLALVLAMAAGCGFDTSPAGDDGSGGGGDGGGGSDPPGPLDATGKYGMHSTFDLATSMPGTAGTVVNTIIAATDEPEDPTKWIVDQIIAQLPDGPIKSALGAGKSFVVGYLNERLLDLAPDFLDTMIQVGHDFGDIARHFGIVETLELTRSGDGYLAVHTITGAHFKLGNQESDYALVNYHVANVIVNNVAVTMDPTGQLTIAAHKLTLPYGKVLRLGLDAAIIPLLDSSAHSLNELLAHKIDCLALGNAIGDAIGFGASAFRSACTSGLNAGANLVYSKIDAIDGTALEFGLNGSARATDKNSDRHIDSIQTGTWGGTLTYGGTPTPLLPAAFFGERM
jgi:hypothetical protein